MAERRVAVLPGDGVGPEVTNAAVRVLEASGAGLAFESHPFGGAAIDAVGEPLPETTLAACRGAQAVLLGAVGGLQYRDASVRPEAGLLALRQALGLFANLRPVRPLLAVAADASPLKPSAIEGVDLTVVRELTSGIYFGRPTERRRVDGDLEAIDTCVYRTSEVRQISELAFGLAARRRGRVTSVDKANVLETSRLWRETVIEVGAGHPAVELEHQLVDSAAMRLLTHAREFDVILTGNMFGDILSDEAAVLAGSIGLLPSASMGQGSFGLYEPIHGSAPDIAGQGIANPVGAILSAAMMLEHSFGLTDPARKIEAAVEAALIDGARTKDLNGVLSTQEMTDEVVARLRG